MAALAARWPTGSNSSRASTNGASRSPANPPYQQPLHHLASGLAGLPATEAPRHLPEQILQQDARLVIR